MLINNNLLTQRSSCIGRIQVEKCVSLFVQWQITAQEHADKHQHETHPADLNLYIATMHLVIILTDDAIKHTCIWPLA